MAGASGSVLSCRTCSVAVATAAATAEGTAGWGTGTLTRATRRRSPSTCSKTNARTADVSRSTTSAGGPSVDTRGSIAPASAPSFPRQRESNPLSPWESNCVGRQAVVTTWGCQGRWSRSIAFSMVSSFRMQATSAVGRPLWAPWPLSRHCGASRNPSYSSLHPKNPDADNNLPLSGRGAAPVGGAAVFLSYFKQGSRYAASPSLLPLMLSEV